MTQPIPLINVALQNQALRREIDEAISGVVSSGAFILGPEVTQFEEEFKVYTGVPHAIGCASGTDGLLLPLMALGVGPGDEVLCPSFTFYATAGSIARLGARPVFVDSDESYNMCPRDAARKMSPKTKAIIPVHLFGQMADMPAILKLARDASKPGHRVGVIEDACQSMGASLEGRQTGLWGDFTAYSFYPTKNLGAMGDAGMMACLTAEDAEALRMLRVHGSKVRYYHEFIGVNSRLDSIQAAILRVKLRHLRGYEDARARHAEHYTKLFSGLEEYVRLPVALPNRRNVWNQYTVRVRDRDALRQYLADQKIGTEIYYPLPMHEQKAFAYAGFRKGDLPVCEALEREVLSLPMFPELEPAQVERVVEAVRGFYRR
ncbi:MAG: DegT/DnrJ/EryC1/StrS family aminotransferase [Bdellovibrionales bacterium]|nr:DegT/DnrJ/EryC1/StrS family aminotransferase [Bdellovibrionales bacterium]